MHKTFIFFEGGKWQAFEYHSFLASRYSVQENCLYVMDNMEYYKVLSNGTPKGCWKKWQMLDY
jgi:hypothetical protein